MKHVVSAFIAMIILVAASGCSRSESADARALLGTIPSDASAVAVVNVKSLLEKAGCKVDGSDIKPSEQVKKLLSNSKNQKGGVASALFFNGETGIDPSVCAIFRCGYYTYLTGMVAETDKFKNTAQKISGAQFSQTDGVQCAGNIALIGSQFWVNIDGNQIDPKEAKHFSSISEKQSFLSVSSAEPLCEFKSDIEAWGNIQGLLNTMEVDFQVRSVVMVALQTIMEDPSDFLVSADFLKGKFEIKAGVLNSKGKPAKFLLPTEKIDVSTIESLNVSASAFMAVSIPNKLIKQLSKETSKQQPSMLAMFLQFLSPLDGTAVVAMDNTGANMKGVISTNGSNASELVSMISEAGYPCRVDGKKIILDKGTPSGAISAKDFAKYAKSAIFAAGGAINQFGPTPFSQAYFTLTTSGGSLDFCLEFITAPDKNAVEAILEYL